MERRRTTSLTRMSARHIWRFAGRELDESRWRLIVHGETVELEIKPLELLLEFLRRPGEVLTKDELLEAVWPETVVVEGSLTTAISKLRKALRDEDQSLLVTAPRIGYRLAADVEVSESEPVARSGLRLEAGQAPPGRAQWRLVRRLGESHVNEVWLAEHAKTGERRIFKFASDPIYLRNLKKEVAVSRLISVSLGERPDFAPALEWNFDTQPFFLEIAYRGLDLPAWAAEQGGLKSVPIETRLDIAAQICSTVAAAHGIGVLHQDLKPANVVLSAGANDGWRAAVVDFGSAGLLDPPSLRNFNITADGFEASASSSNGHPGGTAIYLAPELLAGGAPSTRSDVYALGVMLHQLALGDVTRPLAAGWEREIDDPLLCEDIAAAASGDPAARLASAEELAQRLRALPERRRARAEAKAEADRQAEVERELQRAKARRPWIVLAGTALTAGLIASSALFVVASHERDLARRDERIARQANLFLGEDLLARSNPFKSGKADETLVSAVTDAAPQIDRRFPNDPSVAAQLHHTIAQALDRRGDWDDARREYVRAAELWRAAEGPASPHLHAARLQQIMMEARSYKPGGPNRAASMLAEEVRAIGTTRPAGAEVLVWLASARGMTALIGNDAREAAKQFGLAARLAEAQPALFDLRARLTFLQRAAFAHIRLGDGAEAEALFRRLAAGYAALEGPDGPNVLMVRLNLAQALMIQGRHAEAVREADALYPKMVQALGPTNEMTLQLLSTRAQSEGALERWDAAIADTRLVRAAALKTAGPGSFFGLASLTDGATAECRSGRLKDGLRDVQQARAEAHAAFPGSAIENAIDFTWASCLLLDRQPQAAEQRLAGIRPEAVAQLAGDPDWGANLNLARAEIDLSRGDRDGARRELAAAARAMSKPTAEAYQVRLFKRLRAEAGLPAT